MAGLELFAERTGLLLIDLQERVAASVPDKVLKGTLRNWLNLIEVARVLELPIALSEQMPRTLGHTLPVIVEALRRLPREQVLLFDKQKFSCGGDRELAGWIKRSGATHWVAAGMEAHVAVYLSARDLIARGLEVHVPRDGVVSRTMPLWEVGVKLAERAGAVVSATETVVFDLIKGADSPAFQALSRIVK